MPFLPTPPLKIGLMKIRPCRVDQRLDFLFTLVGPQNFGRGKADKLEHLGTVRRPVTCIAISSLDFEPVCPFRSAASELLAGAFSLDTKRPSARSDRWKHELAVRQREKQRHDEAEMDRQQHSHGRGLPQSERSSPLTLINNSSTKTDVHAGLRLRQAMRIVVSSRWNALHNRTRAALCITPPLASGSLSLRSLRCTQSAVIFALLISWLHFAISDWTSLPNASGLPVTTSAP